MKACAFGTSVFSLRAVGLKTLVHRPARMSGGVFIDGRSGIYEQFAYGAFEKGMRGF